ncbi:MAG: hypothetical protein A3K03_10505 [Bdellovibrionales bacterium RIFOXYD1_FULL_44_7]|nr:MAG: hypothetical protein A3K03_10505 [Bdellovibrionales bacterium RIFOXYD1_FULL_44_7]
MPGTLSRDFYERRTTLVAPDLLGKVLVVRTSKAKLIAARIVETEAYHGEDPASHSCRGKTERCSIMFGPPGVAYVYFIYGMYQMLNFVTEPAGYPGAVLIRAVEPVFGEKLMIRRRKSSNLKVSRTDLTNGPGRLSQAMGIKMGHKGEELWGPSLFVVDDGYSPAAICVSPRVGISVATDRLWRYFITDNPFVSKAPQNGVAKGYRKPEVE